MEVPDLYKNLTYSEKLSREVPELITLAQQANGSFEVSRSYEDAARWLTSRNCLIIEGYDDNNLLCYLPENVDGDILIDSFKYWGDQFDRLEKVHKRLRRARLVVSVNDVAVAAVPPGPEATAADWEAYVSLLELELIKVEARKNTKVVEASAQVVTPIRKKKNNDGAVIVACLVIFLFTIFLLYSVFIK